MKKKKKYRINYKNLFKLIIFIFLLIIGLVFSIKKIFGEKKFNELIQKLKVESKYKAIITDSEEQNKELVKKYFTSGMSVSDYKSSIERIDNYVKVTGKYKKINFDFERKYRYDELENIYNRLALSEMVNLEIIGESVDGRKMYSVEIGKGDDVTMFEAGIHASESANPLFITKFMVDLVNKYENGDEDTIKLLENHKIVILPAANPDGYEITMFGVKALNNSNLYIGKANEEELEYIKFNANGVDLNRNFPSQTSGLYYKKYDLDETVSLTKSLKIYSYYPGESVGSEPETRAIMYWQNKWLPKVKSYVALHSAGQSIFNGKPYLSDEYNNNSNKCASIVGDITDYTVLTKEDEQAGEGNDGTASEYMAETLSGFIFSSKTGRLSSNYYAKYYNSLKYQNTCVIVIEALEKYTNNLSDIKKEYDEHHLEKAYIALIERD